MGDDKPPKPVVVRGTVDARATGPATRGFLDELLAPTGTQRLEGQPSEVDDWLGEELAEDSILHELTVDEGALGRALALSLTVGPDDRAFWARYHARRDPGVSEGTLLEWWRYQDERDEWAASQVRQGQAPRVDVAYQRWDATHAPPPPIREFEVEPTTAEGGSHEIDKMLLMEIEAAAGGFSRPPPPAQARPVTDPKPDADTGRADDQQSRGPEVLEGPHAQTWLIPAGASADEVAVSRTGERGQARVGGRHGLVLTWGDPLNRPADTFSTSDLGLPRWPERPDQLFDCLDERFGGFGGVANGVLRHIQPDEDRRFALWVGLGMDGLPMRPGTADRLDEMADNPGSTMHPLAADEQVPAGDLLVHPVDGGPNRVSTSFGDGTAGTFDDGRWIRYPVRHRDDRPVYTGAFPFGPLPDVNDATMQGCLHQTMTQVIIGIIVAAALAGGLFFLVGGGDDTTDEASPADPTASEPSEPAADDGAEAPLEMAHMIPMEQSVVADGVLGELTVLAAGSGSGVDESRVQAAASQMRVQTAGSNRGGKILIGGGGPDAEGPSGEFFPDGQGGASFEDAKKRDIDIGSGEEFEDSDEISDIEVADGFITFTWVRTNFDGSAWQVPMSLPLPEGGDAWFTALPATGPADCTASVSGVLEGDSLQVRGDTDAEPGTVLEIFLNGGTAEGSRRKVEVSENGTYEADFDAVVRNDSNKVVVEVAKGAHFLASQQVAGG